MADSAEKKVDPFDLSAGVPGIEGELRPKPKFADRISKRVLAVLFIFIGLLLAIFLVSLDNMDKKKAPKPAAAPTAAKSDKDGSNGIPKELKGRPGDDTAGVNSGSEPHPASLLQQAKTALGVSADTGADTTKPAGQSGQSGGSKPPVGSVPSMGGQIPTENSPIPKEGAPGSSGAPLTPQQQAANQAKQDRLARTVQARSGGLGAKGFDGDDSKPTTAGSPGMEAVKSAILQAASGSGAAQAQMPQQQKQGQDSEQDEKLDFVKKAAKEEHGYHPHIPLAALSPHEVKTGSYIPMTLEQGINSDLPGHITARVSEGVYDSVTGCELLIPPLTKVEGEYDSKVAIGQNRILVVWNSMIFPNGDELNLAGMEGYDSSGQAGLQSDVDNHYMRMFGMAFGMSMVTAGIQMSVSPSTSTNGSTSPSQGIATALTQQYGQLGSQMLGKYIAIQPTLRNYAGERFTIMVPHTIVFSKVWAKRCVARSQ